MWRRVRRSKSSKTTALCEDHPVFASAAMAAASEIGRELARLGPDTTGLSEELRVTLTETTDDLPW